MLELGGREEPLSISLGKKHSLYVHEFNPCSVPYSASILQPAVSFPRLDLGSVAILTDLIVTKTSRACDRHLYVVNGVPTELLAREWVVREYLLGMGSCARWMDG